MMKATTARAVSKLGWALGNGLTLTEAKETVGQVAEGLNTLEIVQAEIDDLDIKMPLLEAMHGIIYKKNEKLDGYVVALWTLYLDILFWFHLK